MYISCRVFGHLGRGWNTVDRGFVLLEFIPAVNSVLTRGPFYLISPLLTDNQVYRFTHPSSGSWCSTHVQSVRIPDVSMGRLLEYTSDHLILHIQ